MSSLESTVARLFPDSKKGRVPDRRVLDKTQETGCVIWLGPLNSQKAGEGPMSARPKVSLPGSRTSCLVHREWFAAYHGVKLGLQQHVQNVCGDPTCVSPRHHVLRWGRHARRARGYSHRAMEHVRRLILARVRGATGPGMGFWWHGGPRLWECDPHAVGVVSEHSVMPRMAALTAYAMLFHEANPERGQYHAHPRS